MKKLHLFALMSLALLFAACNSSQSPNSDPAEQAVNGFGSAANHVHSLVVLPDTNHTLILATHYGIFRSENHGATWQQTAAGTNQIMHNLMTFDLTYNPLNPQRLYVLTQVAQVPYTSKLGLYTSGDGGLTWQLSAPAAQFTSGSIYLDQAGNDSPSQVYIYITAMGPLGLLVSTDNGQHFTQAGAKLPFGNVLGLLPVPDKPGHLIVYGNDGIATTSDDGQHWQVIAGIQDSIFEMTTPGPQDPIYAYGDNGIYASQDGGSSFQLVYTQHNFASLTASPQNPQIVYGKLGLGVYRSIDGGKSWSELPVMNNSQQSLTGDVLIADPINENQVYLAISYPVVAYLFQSTSKSWHSITPPT